MSFAQTHREPSFARHAIVVLIIAVATSVAVPANTASAQLGGFVRKARDKVVEQQVDKQIDKLTRFDALGESLGALPFGPTIPEFAALMGALGARQAVALDGGISGQMLVRDASGTAHVWRGMRRVPLALVATPR